jgi:hypothetical protein
MMPRLLLFLFLCCGIAGCRDNDKALLMVDYDFADRQLAGRFYFLHDPAEKSRAQALMSEISNIDAEMQRTMQTRDFMRLPVERRMEIFNQSREETWQLIKELRSLLAGKESR